MKFTSNLILSFPVTICDKKIDINFIKRRYSEFAEYNTENNDIIEVLLKHPKFNILFNTSDKYIPPVKPEIIPVFEEVKKTDLFDENMINNTEITTVQGAKEFLHREFEIKISQMKNKADVLRIGKEYNINFVMLNEPQ